MMPMPTVPHDLRIMSETTPARCAAYSRLLRRAAGVITRSMRVSSPDIEGSRFQSIGFEMTHTLGRDGSAMIDVSSARGGDDQEWEHAKVSLNPVGLGIPKHPLAPTVTIDEGDSNMVAAEMRRVHAMIDHTCLLLDMASDPQREMTPAEVGPLRRRVLGIAAVMMQEMGDQQGVDVVWASHDGPLRVNAYGSDITGGDARNALEEPRRLAWSAGLPPVMGVAERGTILLLRPMLMESARMPTDVVTLLRLASELAGL